MKVAGTRIACAICGLLLVVGCRNGDGSNSQEAATSRKAGDHDSCYAHARPAIDAPVPERAVFVLVDQTTGLDDRLRETIRRNLRGLLVPGTSYTVSTFSAFSQGNYVTNQASGVLEGPLSEDAQSGQPVRRLDRINACLARQQESRPSQAESAVREATSASAGSFSNSEIMASLRQLSEAVRNSPARDKLVIVVSDLLEHSNTTSFYRNRNVRLIEPAAELSRAESERLFGQFGGARVAVIGAGLVSPDGDADTTRDMRALNALQEFWRQWFERSDARLVQYGQPDLMTALGWSSEAQTSDTESP